MCALFGSYNSKMSIRVGRYLIYGLVDPRNRILRYIGKTHKRREIRLAEHIECAKNGDSRAVYVWIRELLERGMVPEIFVWKRISPEDSWRHAEKDAIAFWSNPTVTFPYTHPPQTKKSVSVQIKGVELLNQTKGG